jgi:hypothetical protein
MEPDSLFIETLADLDGRLKPAIEPYRILMSAALLRKLLLDSPSLTDQVNRTWRLKIRYTTNVSDPVWKIVGGPAPVFWSIQDGLDPATALTAAQPADLTRDQFLARPVMVANGVEFTVRDVIAQVAHISGAVHSGSPKNPKEALLAAVSADIQVGGYDPSVRTLQAIGRIVTRGLTPLRDAIEASR